MSRSAPSSKRYPRNLKTVPNVFHRYWLTRRRKTLLILSLLAACCTFYSYHSTSPTSPGSPLDENSDPLSVAQGLEILSDGPHNSSLVESHDVGERLSITEELNFEDDSASLVAILPVTETSLATLDTTISVLLHTPGTLGEIVLLAPTSFHHNIRTVLGQVFSDDSPDDLLDVSIATWPLGIDEGLSVLQTARQIAADRFLLLDTSGLNTIDEATRQQLLGSFATPLPVGPRGFGADGGQYRCIMANDDPQASAFLLPPFSISSLLVPPHDLQPSSVYDIWSALGKHISRARFERAGGIVVAANASVASSWCPGAVPRPLVDDMPTSYASAWIENEQDTLAAPGVSQLPDSTSGNASAASLALLVPRFADVYSFGAALCRMKAQLFHLQILAVEESPVDNVYSKTLPLTQNCHVHVSLPSIVHDRNLVVDWLTSSSSIPQVILHSGLANTSHQHQLSASTRAQGLSASVFIDIPQSQLPYCDWMGTLTIQEWRNWHVPSIDISIITNDRAHSLSRLLASLQNALFFGDTLNVRINVEQTADAATLAVVDAFAWPHGALFVHRRVVHGGLLPAVVESWYPASKDSYGLLLEDDVELSPLFYAWAKMALLRYRYGTPADASPRLYGISLYQQKNLELRPEGRHRFDARALFRAAGLPSSRAHTPFLSAIPCSWGALYFPAPWRAFHAYLAVRLAGAHPALSPSSSQKHAKAGAAAGAGAIAVAPGVRSNRWTHSWKKYFIELVFLRGDAMLYPNYAGWRALSTNHLERGAHVRAAPPDVYRRKKRLYVLPLLELPAPTPRAQIAGDGGEGGNVGADKGVVETGLLDLPGGAMPSWRDLPVTDLFGLLTSMDTLAERGRERRRELFGCADADEVGDDVRALLCMGEEEDDVND
ncbi:hypothetical protein EIP86_005613 [Pleurotus ostreatoroseus]|nr:hypothetical protein EIP86_005613 [Pleurotus ostreatoroseus]